MIRFYLDEHISHVIAGILRRRGIDAVTVQERGRRGLPDEEQLRFAATEGRCLVSENRQHFIDLTRRFQRAGLPHAGVALAPGSLALNRSREVAAALLQLAAEYPEGLAPYTIVWLRPVSEHEPG